MPRRPATPEEKARWKKGLCVRFPPAVLEAIENAAKERPDKDVNAFVREAVSVYLSSDDSKSRTQAA